MIKKPLSPASQKLVDEFVASLDEACPYCTSENPAIRDTYYDQCCYGCVKRMGAGAEMPTIDSEGECESCVDGQCTAGPRCVACSN